MDENGYVFGTIESNIDNWDGPVIGFIAHMDVVRCAFPEHRSPWWRTTQWRSPAEQRESIVLSPEEFPSLETIPGKIWW